MIDTKQITHLLKTLRIDNSGSEQPAYQTTQIDFEIPEEIADPQEQSSTQAQIEIPPKGNN